MSSKSGPNINTFNYFRPVYFQIIGSFVALAITLSISEDKALFMGVFFGALIITVDLFILCWLLKRIFLKKSIALSLSLIVFKWAILGLIIYLMFKYFNVSGLGIFVGLSTLIVSTLFLVTMSLVTKEQNGTF